MMQWQTPVDVPSPSWRIQPTDRILCVGSCFAGHIGRRFQADHFRAVVNPFGVMYNPVSVLHTLRGQPYARRDGHAAPATPCDVAIVTLGTNHVYEELSTGRVVDNCQKRPQSEFREKLLDVEACAETLEAIVAALRRQNSTVRAVFTVSPIRYRKYGYHASQLSKAALLLAIDRLLSVEDSGRMVYFPAYESVNDELRDYRFYAPDMLHPSEPTADYLYARFKQAYFSPSALRMAEEWAPIREALGHRPLHPDSDAYRRFAEATQQRKQAFESSYFPLTTPQPDCLPPEAEG